MAISSAPVTGLPPTVPDYGEYLADGSPETVLRDPRVIQAYLGHAGKVQGVNAG